MKDYDKNQFEFENNLQNDQQRMFDKARESNFSLWNSLLSFNAIIITVFTGFLALNSTTNKTILFIIIFTSMASALLLIFNFKSTKNFYFKEAIDYFKRIERLEKMSDLNKKKYQSLDLKKGEKSQKRVERFENFSIILILFELFLIILFLVI